MAKHQQHPGTQVRERYLAFVGQMQKQKVDMEPLSEAIEHFCHITDNFAAGLFHCYDVEGLPGTNNDLEHCGWRWHVSMSGEPQADGEPFLGSWYVVRFAS